MDKLEVATTGSWRDGLTPSRLGEKPRRGVVAVQSTNVGSFRVILDNFSQCATHWRRKCKVALGSGYISLESVMKALE